MRYVFEHVAGDWPLEISVGRSGELSLGATRSQKSRINDTSISTRTFLQTNSALPPRGKTIAMSSSSSFTLSHIVLSALKTSACVVTTVGQICRQRTQLTPRERSHLVWELPWLDISSGQQRPRHDQDLPSSNIRPSESMRIWRWPAPKKAPGARGAYRRTTPCPPPPQKNGFSSTKNRAVLYFACSACSASSGGSSVPAHVRQFC